MTQDLDQENINNKQHDQLNNRIRQDADENVIKEDKHVEEGSMIPLLEEIDEDQPNQRKRPRLQE